MAVGFNSHSIDLHFQSDEEFSFDGNSVANYFLETNPEGSRGRDLDSDFSVASLHSSGSRKHFTLVTGRKYRRRFSGRLL